MQSSPNTPSGSAAAQPAVAGSAAKTRSVTVASSDNALILRDHVTGAFVLVSKHQDIAIGAPTLLELIHDAEEERVYGVLNITDGEAELLFGVALMQNLMVPVSTATA